MDRITSIKGLRGGRPTIRGLRITVSEVLDMLSNGMSADQILEAFPSLQREDISAALTYAARLTDHPVVTGQDIAAE